MYKKLISLILVAVISALSILPVYADAKDVTEKNKDKVTTKWKMENIEIEVITDHKLTKEEKVEIEDKTKKKISSGDVSINQLPGESTGETIAGPVYRTHNNTVTLEVMKATVGLVSAYIAGVVSTVTYGVIIGAASSYFFDKVKYWLNQSPYTYFGYWETTAWSTTRNARIVYNTAVHYKYSNYTSPTNVYYYDTGVIYK